MLRDVQWEASEVTVEEAPHEFASFVGAPHEPTSSAEVADAPYKIELQ